MIAGDKTYASIVYDEKTYTYRDDVINILCLGIDKEEAMAERGERDNSMGQADAIFLVSFDLKNQDIRVISVPRDTMVMIEMYRVDGTLMGALNGQLTLQYAYGDGQELSATKTAERLSEKLCYLPINGYVAINFESLIAINDAIGGVDITMDDDYTWIDASFVKGTTVHLEGEKAKSYVRGRDTTQYGTALTRMNRLKTYMLTFVEKAETVIKDDMSLPVRLMEELAPYIETSLSSEEIAYLASQAIKCSFLEENMYTLPGEMIHGVYYDEYYLDDDAVAALVVDLFYEPD